MPESLEIPCHSGASDWSAWSNPWHLQCWSQKGKTDTIQHQSSTMNERIPLSIPDSFQKSYLPGHQHLQCTRLKLLLYLYENSLRRSLPRQRCVARSVHLWQLPPIQQYLTAIHSQISSLHKYGAQQSWAQRPLFVKKVVQGACNGKTQALKHVDWNGWMLCARQLCKESLALALILPVVERAGGVPFLDDHNKEEGCFGVNWNSCALYCKLQHMSKWKCGISSQEALSSHLVSALSMRFEEWPSVDQPAPPCGVPVLHVLFPQLSTERSHLSVHFLHRSTGHQPRWHQKTPAQGLQESVHLHKWL